MLTCCWVIVSSTVSQYFWFYAHARIFWPCIYWPHSMYRTDQYLAKCVKWTSRSSLTEKLESFPAVGISKRMGGIDHRAAVEGSALTVLADTTNNFQAVWICSCYDSSIAYHPQYIPVQFNCIDILQQFDSFHCSFMPATGHWCHGRTCKTADVAALPRTRHRPTKCPVYPTHPCRTGSTACGFHPWWLVILGHQ